MPYGADDVSLIKHVNVFRKNIIGFITPNFEANSQVVYECIKPYVIRICTTINRHTIFSTIYSVMFKVYTGYHGTSEIEHGLCACTIDNPLAKARGLSLRTGAQTMVYLSPRVGNTNCLLQTEFCPTTLATIYMY